MNIQPYFPEQEVVPGNVADEKYGVRLRFVRRVSSGYFLTIAAIGVVALRTGPLPDLRVALWVGGGSLLLLSLIRKLVAHTRIDLGVSAALLFPLLASLGVLVRAGIDLGLPLWSLGIAAAFAFGYTALCGRDFSFLGQFVTAGLATIVTLIVLAVLGSVSATTTVAGCAIALLYLSYFVYDLAALLTRRRVGEELPAVADLYRDVLNFLSYSFRVISHWRKFRI